MDQDDYNFMVFLHPIKRNGVISRKPENVQKVWKIVAGLATGDIAILFDTGVFDPIILDYLTVALNRLKKRGNVNEYQAAVAYDEMYYLLKRVQIEDVYDMKKSYGEQ